MQRRTLRIISSSALAILMATRAQAEPPAPDPNALARAKAIYQEATQAMDAKDFTVACPKLERVVRLVPQGVGARLDLARCYRDAGKLASAYTNYRLAESLAAAAARPEREQARREGEALKSKLAKLTIAVTQGVRAAAGLEIQCNGVLVGAAEWGAAVPVDKGHHVIVATATWKRAWEKTIDVDADGSNVTVTIDAMVDTSAAAPEGNPAAKPPSPAIVQAPPPERGADAAPPEARTLSHRGQFGAVLRADIDGQGRGVVAAPGLSFGIGDHVEVAACALIGNDKGFEPALTVLPLHGGWKPRLSAGVPIFVVGGVRPGLRASAGLQWDPLRNLGVFVDAGVAAFPDVPAGYQKFVFVPAVGIQPRL